MKYQSFLSGGGVSDDTLKKYRQRFYNFELTMWKR